MWKDDAVEQGARVLKSGQRWPWGMAIATAVLVTLLVWATWSGRCVDMAPGAGQSYCESGPSVGWPAAVLVSTIALLTVVLAARRLTRRHY